VPVVLRNALIAALVTFALAACVETTSNERIAASEPAKARNAPAAAKTPPAATKLAAAATKMSLPDQARARLRQECMSEHSGPFRKDSATDAECECYAGTVVKALRPADIDFYMNYDVVPTLSGTRPEDVKKSCGIKLLDQSGSRSRAPATVPTN
jgi:hypothetical protein